MAQESGIPCGRRKETVRINAHIRLVEREIEIEVKIRKEFKSLLLIVQKMEIQNFD